MKNFKRNILILSVFFTTLLAGAYDFESNGIYYNILSKEARTVAVTAGDRIANNYSGEVEVPAIVSHEGTAYMVSAVDIRAFGYCYDLEKVSLPETVLTVGQSAFLYCEALKEVTFSEGLQIIEPHAFDNCISLQKISFPSTLQLISEQAFTDCESLADINFGSKSSLELISVEAFARCKSLTNVTLPASLTFCGERAFLYCSNLEAISVASANEKFSSFEGVLYNKDFTEVVECPGALTSVTLKETVTKIQPSAFYGCFNLKEVAFPSSLEAIGGWAFFGCLALQEISLPESVKTIGAAAFKNCAAITEVKLPPLLTEIPESAFSTCYALKSIDIHNNITSIGNNAFSECFALTKAEIGHKVTTIGDRAFHFCTALTDVTLGESVEWIGFRAFMGDEEIQNFLCYPEVPPVVDGELVEPEVYESATLYVLLDSLMDYASISPWSNFSNFSPSLTDVSSLNVDSESIVRVYSLDGILVKEGSREILNSIPKGIYIIKENGTARKVII